MTLGTTRTVTRARGPLALAGGVVATLVVLGSLALERPDPVPATVDVNAPGTVERDGGVSGALASQVAAPARVALAGGVPSTRTADRAAAEPALMTPPTSTGAWTAWYRDLSDDELATAVEAAFGPDGQPNQRVGLLGASVERGADLARPALLAAASFAGDPDRPRAVSLASHTLTLLERRSDQPGFRAVLQELTWDPSLGLSPRLRGRAAAHLVRTAHPDEAPELRAGLYGELDPTVTASAGSVLVLAAPDLRLALADLFPEAAATPSTRDPRDR